MTYIEKSDAQLDAEAEARRRQLDLPQVEHGLDDPDSFDAPAFRPSSPPPLAPELAGLARLIEQHRAMYRDELNISRLVSRQPPTSLDPNTGLLDAEPATTVGMTISGALLRRLGPPKRYGALYPWKRALWLARVDCRRKHPHHRSAERPYWRGSLCHQAAKLVIIGGEVGMTGPLSVQHAGKILRVDRMEPLLRNVFRYITEQIDLARWRAERRQREDHGYSSVFERSHPMHHAVGGLHERECPQCVA